MGCIKTMIGKWNKIARSLCESIYKVSTIGCHQPALGKLEQCGLAPRTDKQSTECLYTSNDHSCIYKGDKHWACCV